MLNGFTTITPQTIKVDMIKMIKFKEVSGPEVKFSFLKNRTPKVKPKTRAIFATLDPTTFPTTIEALPSIAAKRLVNISGAEVPKAITVEPIRNGDMPYLEAVKTEYFSSFCALKMISTIPEMMKINVRVDMIGVC